MKFRTSITKFGGSVYLLLPKEIVEYLGLETGEEQAVVEEKLKSKGKFAAFWKNEGAKK